MVDHFVYSVYVRQDIIFGYVSSAFQPVLIITFMHMPNVFVFHNVLLTTCTQHATFVAITVWPLNIWICITAVYIMSLYTVVA